MHLFHGVLLDAVLQVRFGTEARICISTNGKLYLSHCFYTFLSFSQYQQPFVQVNLG